MLDQKSITELTRRIRGPVLRPGDPVYDERRKVWNGMIDRRPAAIARCRGVADVAEAVRFARERGLALTIRGGGHNIAGLAVADDALMLDMSLMRGIRVDAAARVARTDAGCLLSDVDRETQLHGLAAVMGFVSTTGVAGLTLGGGFGYLTRRYGYTSDTVESMEMVTADGSVVKASADENADLFWGLRGGGGNFGVVTRFDYRLRALGPEITGGIVAWPASEAEEVLEMYRSVSQRFGPEVTCVAILRTAPPAPWLPPEIHGQPIVALLVCHSGLVEVAAGELEPIKNFGSPVGDTVQTRTYVSQQTLLDATQPSGRRYYWKSEYLSGLDPKMIAGAIAHSKRFASPHGAIILFPIDGAINRLAPDHSPVGNRDAKWVLNITAGWDSAADDAPNMEWARSTWADLRRFSTGGTYLNFLTEEEGEDRIRAAYGANYERLKVVKGRWDPENFFRVNKNIPVPLVQPPPTAA